MMKFPYLMLIYSMLVEELHIWQNVGLGDFCCICEVVTHDTTNYFSNLKSAEELKLSRKVK